MDPTQVNYTERMLLYEVEEFTVQRNDLENDDKYLKLLIICLDSLHIACLYFNFLARFLMGSKSMSSKSLV